jgi:hypothetical protein
MCGPSQQGSPRRRPIGRGSHTDIRSDDKESDHHQTPFQGNPRDALWVGAHQSHLRGHAVSCRPIEVDDVVEDPLLTMNLGLAHPLLLLNTNGLVSLVSLAGRECSWDSAHSREWVASFISSWSSGFEGDLLA